MQIFFDGLQELLGVTDVKYMQLQWLCLSGYCIYCGSEAAKNSICDFKKKYRILKTPPCPHPSSLLIGDRITNSIVWIRNRASYRSFYRAVFEISKKILILGFLYYIPTIRFLKPQHTYPCHVSAIQRWQLFDNSLRLVHHSSSTYRSLLVPQSNTCTGSLFYHMYTLCIIIISRTHSALIPLTTEDKTWCCSNSVRELYQ